MTNQNDYTGCTITTGFLTGNLIQDPDGIDVDASAQAYRRILQAKLEATYPGADIEVLMEDASGSTPANLWTTVTLPGGHDRDAENEIAETVDRMAGKLAADMAAWVIIAEEDLA